MITELKRTYLMDLLGAEKLSTWSEQMEGNRETTFPGW